MKKKKSTISAQEFDRLFDSGADMTAHLDWASAIRPGLDQRRVNVDFPVWMIEQLDQEARRVGVTRQSVIKMWIAERLKDQQHPA